MKVRTKCNVKYNAVWHSAGETIEIDEKELPALRGMVELAEAIPEKPDMEKTGADTESAKPVRAGRKPRKQTEE